jgi:4-hydroxythreonine-4-phosphate dehydrogenase
MAFSGPKLQISLLTGHIPLRKVPTEIEKSFKNDDISQLIQWSHLLFNSLCLTSPLSKKTHRHQQTQQPKPLALLGLNPHAGDQGLIGTEEIAWLKKTRNLGTKLMGPLSPDTAFSEEIRRKVCGYLCLYHDQGLIPFKLLHGFNEGCQISLGLPFWRTSVDHGPAFDLYAKNLAQHGSMLAALKTCEVLVNKVKLLK